MGDDHELEKKMKTYRAGPGPQVKEAIMTKFRETHQKRSSRMRPVGFWNRPIPLYAATLFLVVVVAISFFVGQKSSQMNMLPNVSQEASQDQDSTAAQVLTWRSAQRDIL